MPMRYRSDSTIQPLSPESTAPTDADDSIVLSDLVRTGEASRLRRRGAMRLDHNLASAQRNDPGRATPPTVVVARTPSWIEVPSDDDDSTQAWEQGYGSSSPRPQGRSVTAELDTYGYTLYCGGGATSSSFVQDASLYVRSPIPSYPPPRSTSSRRRLGGLVQKTNGCGAVIHLRASRRDESGVWIGKDQATSAVIPLDASYFERPTVVKMIRSACGCVREGVGCAICGNTLGTRYKPCQTAADGLFSLNSSSQAPICPQGPRYWHGRASPSTCPSYIYTFFASNVTRAAQPPPSRVPPSSLSSQEEESFYAIDNADAVFLDRLASASPLPMTDEDRNEFEQNQNLRPSMDMPVDPDGAPLPNDPGSPDKTHAELMLLPER